MDNQHPTRTGTQHALIHHDNAGFPPCPTVNNKHCARYRCVPNRRMIRVTNMTWWQGWGATDILTVLLAANTVPAWTFSVISRRLSADVCMQRCKLFPAYQLATVMNRDYRLFVNVSCTVNLLSN